MSVLIKGMEMPTRCTGCPFVRDVGDYTFVGCKLNVGLAVNRAFPYRHGDCPLVPVPPHGRLIDADAMLMRINHEVMEAYMDGVCYGVHPSQEYLDLLGEIIDDAPTIIPAEEGET